MAAAGSEILNGLGGLLPSLLPLSGEKLVSSQRGRLPLFVRERKNSDSSAMNVVCQSGLTIAGSTVPGETNSNDFVFLVFQQIRIRFSSSRIFSGHSKFWCVQSSITHHVAVYVPVLWPVCTHTITFRMLWLP